MPTERSPGMVASGSDENVPMLNPNGGATGGDGSVSRVPDVAGWWLASDGKWYPPESAAEAQALPVLTLPTVPSPAVPAQNPMTGAPVPPAAPYSPWSADYPPHARSTPYPPGYSNPYPYPYLQGPGQPVPKTSSMAVWALVLSIVLGALGALVAIPLAFVARSKIRQSGGALRGSGLALAALIVGFAWIGLFMLAIAIPTFLGVTRSGPPLPLLNYNAYSQITGTGPGDFHASGVSDVVCERPTQWTAGSTFTCIAYGAAGSEVGTYIGTVEPNAFDGTYQWDGRYYPSG